MATNTSPTIDVNDPRAITSMVTFVVNGAMGTFSFLPMVVGNAGDDLGMTAQSAGLLASAEMAGASLGTLVVSPRSTCGTVEGLPRRDCRSSFSARCCPSWLESTACSPAPAQ